jgi:hypothetical protein
VTILLILCHLALLPFDVANSKSSANLQLDLAYQVFYICVIVMIFCVVPFAIVYDCAFQQSDHNFERRNYLKTKTKMTGLDPVFQKTELKTKTYRLQNLRIWIQNSLVDFKESMQNLSIVGIFHQLKWAFIFTIPLCVAVGGASIGFYFLLSSAKIPIVDYRTNSLGLATLQTSVICKTVKIHN